MRSVGQHSPEGEESNEIITIFAKSNRCNERYFYLLRFIRHPCGGAFLFVIITPNYVIKIEA